MPNDRNVLVLSAVRTPGTQSCHRPLFPARSLA